MINKKYFKKEYIVIIILIVIILINIFMYSYNYRKIALINLEQISTNLMQSYDTFMRNREYYDDNYMEVNQLNKSLSLTLNNVQYYRVNFIPSNSINAINNINFTIMNIHLNSYNIEVYYEKIKILFRLIYDSMENTKYGDISKENYGQIIKVLDEIRELTLVKSD